MTTKGFDSTIIKQGSDPMNDTIAAIATPIGIGGISVIRISGPEAIREVNELTLFKHLLEKESHTINYDKIVNGDEIVDEVLITVMKSPKTYTKEDVVEINCHGGFVSANKILSLLIAKGIRLAEPGEFTKRAFLNGRIDLIEAEGIIDVINAKTEMAQKMAVKTVNGEASKLIDNLKTKLLDIISNIEVNIDYPEYEDIKQITIEDLTKEIKEIEIMINDIIRKSETGKIIKEGINIAIVGRPNVGKSSLLNAILKEDKAIVTDVEGTTRDVVEGSVQHEGIIFNFKDTAGIRKTKNKIEALGVNKSYEVINNADIIICILNNNEKLTKEDKAILDQIKNKRHLIVINKIDLTNKLNFNNHDAIKISTLNNQGIDTLLSKIKDIFCLNQIEQDDYVYLTGSRNLALLKEILLSINSINEGIKNNFPIDMLEIDIKQILSILNKIIGEEYSEEVIDHMFKNFCLGK